jgi:uncharacterized protein
MSTTAHLRLLIVPGLHGSGPDHWQTWLQARHPGAQRLQVDDWDRPDLDPWAAALQRVVASDPTARWLVVAHSFGCLTTARWAALHRASASAVVGALLVAPANPMRFHQPWDRVDTPLPFRSIVVSSRNDPWFDADESRLLSKRWGATVWDAGEAGHINVASGHGPWPDGEYLLATLRTETAPCGLPTRAQVSRQDLNRPCAASV